MFLVFVLVFANLFLPTTCGEINAIVGTTAGLGHRYFVGCTIIAHPYPQKFPSRKVLTLVKILATPWGQQGCVLTANIERVKVYMDGLPKQTKCSRVLIMVYGDEEKLRLSFTKLTHTVYAMKGPLWLIFLKSTTNVAEYLKGVNAPFDVDMVTAQYQVDGTVKLNEVYRASLQHPVRVVKYGNWSESEGLVSPNHVSLYYRRNNFEGLKFKVATTNTYPITSLIRNENGSIDIVGYFATVWKDLENRLNFTSNYLAAKDNSTGILRGGVWSGVTGMVAREEVEVGIASLTISPERSYVVDFLRPLLSTRNQMFFKKPGLLIRMDSIFRPFQFWIWVTLLGWLLVGSIIFSIFVKISIIFSFESDPYHHRNFNLINAFFLILRSFSQQGSQAVPGTASGRIVFITTYLMGVVMVSAYAGALISFIAVQIPRQPFKNLVDLLVDGSYKVIVVKDTSTYMYFANGTHPTLVNVYNRLMEKHNLPTSTQEALENVCQQKKLVYFGPQAAAQLMMEDLNNLRDCEIMTLQQPLDNVYLSIAIHKNNQYKDALNHHLDMMGYQGLLGRLRRAAWPMTHHHRQRQGSVGMKLEQVVQIHVILIGGLFLAFFIFVGEKYWRKRTAVRHNSKSQSLFLNSFNKV